MAKVILVIEDTDDGNIELTLSGDELFPKDMQDWSMAQRASMYAYHQLGMPHTTDLATTDTEGEG